MLDNQLNWTDSLTADIYEDILIFEEDIRDRARDKKLTAEAKNKLLWFCRDLKTIATELKNLWEFEKEYPPCSSKTS